MFRIVLINMPFAELDYPSIGLTQLKTVVDKETMDRVKVEIIYLNHEIVSYIGYDFYQKIISYESYKSGIAEWIFRQIAFPDLTDNSDTYWGRYWYQQDKKTNDFKCEVQEKRTMMDFYLNELIAKHDLVNAKLIGFTSLFKQHVASLAMARKIKEKNANIITVIGGANCEGIMGLELVRNVNYIDYVFSGPALKTFPKLIQNYLEGNVEENSKIKGVFSRGHSNCTDSDLHPDCFKNMSLLKNSHLFGDNNYDINVNIELNYESFLDSFERHFRNKDIQPSLLFETSRGCWWGEKMHCTFCGLNGCNIKYYKMKPENIRKQLKSIMKYSNRCKKFDAVDNVMPKELPTILTTLNIPEDISFFYEVRPGISTADMKRLSQARVIRIQPGIESLATSTLKRIKKGTTAFRNINQLKNCLLYGIYPVWNLLIGLPGDSDEIYSKYYRDIPLLHHFPPPTLAEVRFDRFSPYFENSDLFGLDLHPFDYYELIYPFRKESLRRMAYYFVNYNGKAKYLRASAKWFNRIDDRVNEWKSRWHKAYLSCAPMLFIKQGISGSVIYDSRNDDVIEYKIDDIKRRILDFMEKPRRKEELLQEFNNIPEIILEKEIVFLQDKRLLFSEDGRLMSLVLPTEPQSMSFLLDIAKKSGSTGLT